MLNQNVEMSILHFNDAIMTFELYYESSREEELPELSLLEYLVI